MDFLEYLLSLYDYLPDYVEVANLVGDEMVYHRVSPAEAIELIRGPGHWYTPVNQERLKAGVEYGYAHFIEFDHSPRCVLTGFDDKEDSPINLCQWVQDVCETEGIPLPTFKTRVGESYHYYWVLESAELDLDKWEADQALLNDIFGSDRSIKNRNRIMRVPGSVHPRTNTEVKFIEWTGQKCDRVVPPNAPTRPAPKPKKEHLPSDLNFGESLVDQVINQKGDPAEVFTWPGHNFRFKGDRFQGDCPGHKSKSGSSFWCKRSENSGHWIWACPTCTDNRFYNVLAYQHWLKTGVLTQPTGAQYTEALNNVGIEANMSDNVSIKADFDLDDFIANNATMITLDTPEDEHSLAWSRYSAEIERVQKIEDKFEKDFEISQLAKIYSLKPETVRAACNPALKTKKLEFRSCLEFLEDTSDHEEFIYLDLIPTSEFIMLSSAPGVGKSNLVGDLIASVTTHGEFLGQSYMGRRDRVLYIPDDESKFTVKNRLNRCGVDSAKIDLGWGLTVSDISELEEAIAEGGYALCVIDSFTSMIRGSGIDENHAGAADCLYQLADIAHKYGTTVIVIHHNNKSGGVSGSQRLTAPCWSVISLERHELLPANQILIYTTKTRASTPWGLVVEPDYTSDRTFGNIIQRHEGAGAKETLLAVSSAGAFWDDSVNPTNSVTPRTPQYRVLGLNLDENTEDIQAQEPLELTQDTPELPNFSELS